jgi:hypothetical protein
MRSSLRTHAYKVSQHVCVGCHFDHEMEIEEDEILPTSFDHFSDVSFSFLQVTSIEGNCNERITTTEKTEVDWTHLILSSFMESSNDCGSRITQFTNEECGEMLAASFDESDIFEAIPCTMDEDYFSTATTTSQTQSTSSDTSLEFDLIQEFMQTRKSTPIPIMGMAAGYYLNE